MRFNDGFWLLKSGVKAYYGLQVVQGSEDGNGYNLQVSTKPIRHRGDTLAGPVLSVRVYSPTEGVIGVKIEHFKHVDPTPNIALFPDDPPVPSVSLAKTETTWSVTTGGLKAEITQNPYAITFKSPTRTLTAAGYKHQAVFDVPYKWTLRSASSSSCLTTDVSSNPHPGVPPETVRYVHSELNLSPGELIYGLGEQFGPFVKNGQSVSIWNQDGGTSSEQAYKCVPFYLTNRNYGVFVNHPGEVEFEVASEKVSRVGANVAGESIEYFVIYGPTPLEILERYTRLTGRPALLPAWTFGLWLSTSFLTSYDEKTVSGFLEGMQTRNCPVRVFHLDCFWMKQYEWYVPRPDLACQWLGYITFVGGGFRCSFTFDPENFPDPKAYLYEIKQKYGVQICVWINPYISQLSPIFQEAVREGYLIKRKDGTPWQERWDLWQPGLGVVDVTNPDARKWYEAKLDALIDLGVDTFKTDFGERTPHADVVFHDGSDPKRIHNTYSVIYNEMVFRLLERRFGKGEAVVFARSATTGGQRFPVHWGGDCESTFEAMAETLRGGLSLTSSGFAFASHDIGGFEAGLVAIFLLITSTHLALQGNTKGHPIQRAMFIEFLEDRTTHHLDRQYMFGPSLLVAPVFVPEGEESEYYLPEGRWTSFFHPSRTQAGPAWVKEVVAIDELPVWVRQGSVLCLGPSGIGRPDYDFASGLEVQVYELDEGQVVQAEVPMGKGITIAGTVEAALANGEVFVRVVSGQVGLASVSYFAGGRIRKAEVAQGEKEVSLKL
ncbi:Glycoside Hydrolase Family 31 protein [Trametes cinnabarina]|uniref:Glycoside Hydrolase Family 31 protein n=1 Tax=Pycnoporus cinnabarinus TaxID=5643 RepID=A0A060S879_PYCCI|nr:Glycoside Hydrolase Family 31 protein [Trametes cinnabarina]